MDTDSGPADYMLFIDGKACGIIEAITGIENSLKQAKPRALLQMATGSGKTFTAVTEVYRPAKFCKAKRVLFLVDRGNLWRQVLEYFDAFLIGLTATPTPTKKTIGFFNRNLPALEAA